MTYNNYMDVGDFDIYNRSILLVPIKKRLLLGGHDIVKEAYLAFMASRERTKDAVQEEMTS